MDKLDELIARAFKDVCEAEKIAYAGGMSETIGADLIEAHSALLRAKNRQRATEKSSDDEYTWRGGLRHRGNFPAW